jgi:hypothetical protein
MSDQENLRAEPRDSREGGLSRRFLALPLLALTLGLGPPADPGPRQPPISGVVFLDRNGNGRRDEGEPGVQGARVSDQVQTVRSDSSGRWSIALRHDGDVGSLSFRASSGS